MGLKYLFEKMFGVEKKEHIKLCKGSAPKFCGKCGEALIITKISTESFIIIVHKKWYVGYGEKEVLKNKAFSPITGEELFIEKATCPNWKPFNGHTNAAYGDGEEYNDAKIFTKDINGNYVTTTSPLDRCDLIT